jgi:hypothetical protein
MKLLRVLGRKVRVSKRTNSVDTARHWGQRYLARRDTVMKEANLETLDQFSNELGDFVSSLRSRWMGKRLIHLKPEKQQLLHTLLQALIRLQWDVAYRMREVEKDRKLLREMEALAFPEPTGLDTSRDYAEWLRSPLYYSEGLLAVVEELPIPQ